MLHIRSFLFLVFQLTFIPIYSTLIVCSMVFSLKRRYFFATGMARILIAMLGVICKIRYEVRGLENIPNEPCIIMSKHQSAWETLALQIFLPRQTYVVKRELLWIPFFGWALASIHPIAINRKDGKNAIRQLLLEGKDRLKSGISVIVFPEGTRTKYGERVKYKIGGAMLAVSAGAQVLPIAHNAGKFWGRKSFLKYPGTIQVHIGPPINAAGLKIEELNQQVEDWIETEMEHLD